MLFVVANERHNDLDGRPLCGGGAEEVLGALEGRSHVIPRDFVRLLVCLQGRWLFMRRRCNSPPPDAADKYFRALYVEHRCRVRGHRSHPEARFDLSYIDGLCALHQFDAT